MNKEFYFVVMSCRIRKYDSGHEKRKKKQRLEMFAQTQKGALDRFIVKGCQASTENQNVQTAAMTIMVITQTMLRLTLRRLMKLGTTTALLMVLMPQLLDQLVRKVTMIRGFLLSPIYLIQDIGMDLIKKD